MRIGQNAVIRCRPPAGRQRACEPRQQSTVQTIAALALAVAMAGCSVTQRAKPQLPGNRCALIAPDICSQTDSGAVGRRGPPVHRPQRSMGPVHQGDGESGHGLGRRDAKAPCRRRSGDGRLSLQRIRDDLRDEVRNRRSPRSRGAAGDARADRRGSGHAGVANSIDGRAASAGASDAPNISRPAPIRSSGLHRANSWRETR